MHEPSKCPKQERKSSSTRNNTCDIKKVYPNYLYLFCMRSSSQHQTKHTNLSSSEKRDMETPSPRRAACHTQACHMRAYLDISASPAGPFSYLQGQHSIDIDLTSLISTSRLALLITFIQISNPRQQTTLSRPRTSQNLPLDARTLFPRLNSYVLVSAISFDPQAEVERMRSPGVLATSGGFQDI